MPLVHSWPQKIDPSTVQYIVLDVLICLNICSHMCQSKDVEDAEDVEDAGLIAMFTFLCLFLIYL